MFIKLDNEKNLVVTVYEPIYRGDNLKQKITFLIPRYVDDIDMLTATVYLSYIRADETADIVLLERKKESYNESYYQYEFLATCSLTRYPGEIIAFLQIYSGSPWHPSIVKSGECILRVMNSTNMDEYISDRNLSLIDEMQNYMADKVEKAKANLNERIDKVAGTVAVKADNIVFNAADCTIQLVSTVVTRDEDGNEVDVQQIPLGDPIFICTNTSRNISSMEINAAGELVIAFDDGTEQNLGNVVGEDGKVYVPHIDEHKVLTFTIRDGAGEVPTPVDLNPHDEWVAVGENTQGNLLPLCIE